MGYTYDSEGAVAAMVRTALPTDGHYDVKAITAYLWQKTDVNSGFMDVTVGELFDVIDTNRLDIPQIRNTVAVVEWIVSHLGASILDHSYSAFGNAAAPGSKYTALVENIHETRQFRIEVLSVGNTSPVVRLYDVMVTYGEDVTEEASEILVAHDATEGLAKFGKLIA